MGSENHDTSQIRSKFASFSAFTEAGITIRCCTVAILLLVRYHCEILDARFGHE